MSTAPTHLHPGADGPAPSDSPSTSKSSPAVSDTLTEFAHLQGILNSDSIEPLATTIDHTTPQLLSIPPPAVSDSSSSLALSDDTDNSNALDPLSPDITSADITVAREYRFTQARDNLLTKATADGSFVETTSGLAARELKRYWDQQIGVGKDVRSPYAITAFVNQHGKSMFRVGCVPLRYQFEVSHSLSL